MTVNCFANESAYALAEDINTWLEETEKELERTIVIHSISHAHSNEDNLITALVVWSAG